MNKNGVDQSIINKGTIQLAYIKFDACFQQQHQQTPASNEQTCFYRLRSFPVLPS